MKAIAAAIAEHVPDVQEAFQQHQIQIIQYDQALKQRHAHVTKNSMMPRLTSDWSGARASASPSAMD
jgi:hypothetical protein